MYELWFLPTGTTLYHSVGIQLLSGDTSYTDLEKFIDEQLKPSLEEYEPYTIGSTAYRRRDYIKESSNGLPTLYASAIYTLIQGKYISLSVYGETPQQRDELVALLQPL